MQPTIGRIVIYKLTGYDAEAINKRRQDWQAHRQRQASFGSSSTATVDIGYQAHSGNTVREGQEYPLVITAVNGTDVNSSVNGQVLLDGNDTFWATSRKEGESAGDWHWPVLAGQDKAAAK